MYFRNSKETCFLLSLCVATRLFATKETGFFTNFAGAKTYFVPSNPVSWLRLPIENVAEAEAATSSCKSFGIIKTAGTLKLDWKILGVQQVFDADI